MLVDTPTRGAHALRRFRLQFALMLQSYLQPPCIPDGELQVVVAYAFVDQTFLRRV